MPWDIRFLISHLDWIDVKDASWSDNVSDLAEEAVVSGEKEAGDQADRNQDHARHRHFQKQVLEA